MWTIIQLIFAPVLSSLLKIVVIDSSQNGTDHSSKTGSLIEGDKLAQFRNMVSDLISSQDEYCQTDDYLLRWLRAKNYDVRAATKMLQEAHQWREDNRMDSILSEHIFSFNPPPYKLEGQDKEGYPIGVMTPTAIDYRKLIIDGKREKLVRYVDQMYETGFVKLKNLTRLAKNGKQMSQLVIIMDLKGFNLKQHFCLQCLGMYLEWNYHYENYYPDFAKLAVVINLNRGAVSLLNAITPMVSEATRNAMRTFGTDQKEWSEFLLSRIDADQLSRRFGGTRPD